MNDPKRFEHHLGHFVAASNNRILIKGSKNSFKADFKGRNNITCFSIAVSLSHVTLHGSISNSDHYLYRILPWFYEFRLVQFNSNEMVERLLK